MRTSLASALALVAAALAGTGCRGQVTAEFQSERVTRGPVAEVVTATGEVSALVTVAVGTQVSGTIARLHADFNDRVRRGDVLAELDARLLEAALARADAAVVAAEADVERARVLLADAELGARRLAALEAQRLVAAAEADAARSARDGAAAGLQAARARALQAKAERDGAATNVALTRIRSPIDGIVIARNVEVGQTVAASLQAPTLFLIANDLSRMQVVANVDEADVGKVREGLLARFTVDAFPGEVFQGRVREVRQAPSTIQNVVTYPAVIEAANPERKLRQGMTAAVTMITRQRASVLRVPNAALRFRGAAARGAGEARAGGALPGVATARAEDAEAPAAAPEAGGRAGSAYRLAGGVPVKVALRLGISDGRQTEVLAGLAEGERVVVAADDAAPAKANGGKRGPF